VLVHIGLDTVMLRGEGFTPLVKLGQRVARGQPLIRFDLDALAGKARSLLTEVIIANMDAVAAIEPRSGLVDAGDTLMRVSMAAGASKIAALGATSSSDPVSLPNAQGLHARPAAVLAAEAKRFKSEVKLVRGTEEVNAKSVVAIMGLSTKLGDVVHVRASGPDAVDAAAVLARLLGSGSGETPVPAGAPVSAEPVAVVQPVATAPGELAGVSASPGLAVGSVVQLRQQVFEVQEIGESATRERARLDAALKEAHQQVESLGNQQAGSARAQILSAHRELLDDPDLLDLAITGISNGQSAGFAWREAFTSHAARLEALDNPLLRERANDIRDIGRRVLGLLAGVQPARLDVKEGSILVAEELTPSDTAQMDRSRVLGFCTTGGGATSHVAILARSLGIPAICGIDEAALALADGTRVVLDGTRGVLHGRPGEDDIAQAEQRMARLAVRRAEEQAAADAPALTLDGHRVEVAANIRNAADAADAVAHGADGVGLLRSEFLFEDRETMPTEAEQAAEYVAVAQALGRERPLVIRTLDVGGDKPLSYLPLPKEDNPFLGVRGVRLGFEKPEMMRAQLRAILRAAPHGNLHVMFPMIATVDEFRLAKSMLLEEAGALGAQAKVGAMIEVPSAALMADALAREADFFSIGTNDLTQYVLAMDRGHPKLARLADALHPAVLKTIAMTARAPTATAAGSVSVAVSPPTRWRCRC
jgi:phosphocarrier protein FPr/phosphocarrier protein